jgi:shikimate kinase
MVNRIILITGPKHSGKSKCALALKKLLGCEAVDLDELVEAHSGKTPRVLYTEDPEIFKKAEAKALASLLRPPEGKNSSEQNCLIVSAGGGLIDNDEAMELFSATQCRETIPVYLEVSAKTAWQRILETAKNEGLPPFLNTENPRETQRAMHDRRAKAYKAIAKITVFAENKSPEEIAREIAALMLR